MVYCTAHRCGLDTSRFIRVDDFAAIAQFNTLEAVNGLGVPTVSMTRTALDAIAPEMRLLYRRWELEHQHEQDNTKRSADNNGRAGDDGARGERTGDPLSDGERVLAPGAGVPGAEAGAAPESVGPSTHEVSGGAGAAAPDESGDQRGELPNYLTELQNQAENMMEGIVEHLIQQEGVTEELTAVRIRWEWVRRMESIQNRAREVVMAEVICQ